MIATPSKDWIPSSRRQPCPICNRTKDGDCRTSSDGMEVVCHHPKDHTPGKYVVNGWAFTGNTSDGRAGHFVLDKPRSTAASRPPLRVVTGSKPQQQRQAAPAPITGSITLAATTALPEATTQQLQARSGRWDQAKPRTITIDGYGNGRHVERIDKLNGDKLCVPYCRGVKGAGPEPWPLYQEGLALQATGQWLLEVEGEKVADLALAGGLIATTQPGHAHKREQIEPRYQRLLEAGIKGVVFLADNDEEGARRMAQAQEAAAAVGLPFLPLPAAEVWPDLPAKGSIDDAPGGLPERVGAITAAVERTARQQATGASEAKPTQAPVLTIAQVQERLRQAVEEGYSHADLAALVADLAQSTGHPASTIRDLLKAIEKEEVAAAAIKAETLSIRAEADRRELGQALTLGALFPPSIAEALQIRCQALPADDVAAAVTFMVAVSGLAKLGTRVVANKAIELIVPVNIFGALVADSGAKKSPLNRQLVQAPTQELRLELAQQHDRAMKEWQEACRGLKATERPEPPRAAYLQVSDTTAEALASQLQEQEARGLGMLFHRDELAGLFGSLNAYRSGRGADEEMLLEAYDGSGFHSLRVATAGGGRFYDRCHLSVWGTIQPAVLQGLVADGDASGLWARFLFVPLPQKVVPLPEHETEVEQRAAAAAARTLADACRAVYRRPASDLKLSREAWQAFRLYEANRQGDALRGAIQAQKALYGKAAGKVLRLAGLLHLLQLVAPDGAGEAEISAATMDNAIRLVDHLNAWALSFHADLSNGGTSDLMRLVHRAATAAGGPVRWKEIRSGLSKAKRQEVDSAAVAAAMAALAELGVGEVEVGARGGSSYRATAPLP